MSSKQTAKYAFSRDADVSSLPSAAQKPALAAVGKGKKAAVSSPLLAIAKQVEKEGRTTPKPQNPGILSRIIKQFRPESSKRSLAEIRAINPELFGLLAGIHASHVLEIRLACTVPGDYKAVLEDIAAALKSSPLFHVRVIETPLPFAPHSETEQESLWLEEQVREVLVEGRGEIMILCTPVFGGTVMDLKFVPVNANGAYENIQITPEYVFNISTPVAEGDRVLLQAVTLASVSIPVKSSKWSTFGPAMKAELDLIEQTTHQFPETFTPLQQARACQNIGMAFLSGAQLGDPDSTFLIRAEELFTEALSKLDMVTNPLDWARAQRSLGITRMNMGQLDPARDALAAAMTIYTHSTHPRVWAGLNSRIGTLLYQFGEEDGDSELIKRSLVCFRNALKVFSYQISPKHWTDTMMQFAQAAQAFGRMGPSLDSLATAASAYSAIISITNPNSKPMFWARAKNNLGSTLFMIGKQTRDVERLEAAALAFRHALRVYDLKKAVKQAHVTTKNLNHVKSLLEQFRGSIPINRNSNTRSKSAINSPQINTDHWFEPPDASQPATPSHTNRSNHWYEPPPETESVY